MNPQALAALLAMASGSDNNQSLTKDKIEVIMWNGMLIPAKGKEQAPFSSDKYTHTNTDGSNPRFVVHLVKPTTDINDMESTQYSYFLNSREGEVIKNDIDNKFGQWIVAPPVDNPTQPMAKCVNQIGGAFVDIDLCKSGRAFDIHYLNKQGQPITDGNGKPYQPSLNRTSEKVWLTTKEINNIADTIQRYQNRVAKQTGASSKYRPCISVDNTPSTTPIVIPSVDAMPQV